jgi:hypothetical protein
MKYLFTTLAVGESYLNTATKFYSDLESKTSQCDFNITTNVKLESTGRINFDYFTLDRYDDGDAGFSFFLNLKALSLKYALDKGYDYVIFTDADWGTTDGFSEEKILSLFEYIEEKNIDALFERPNEIGYNKEHINECYFKEKIQDYHVIEHIKWDKAHVFNEQFFVLKINWKYRYFVRRWEEMMWYSIANDIRNYPDGFEIGVAALEAEMKFDFNEWRNLVPDCFMFYNKLNQPYYRF